MKSILALAVLLASTGTSHAGDIRSGATMHVKADSIWFQDRAKLMRWQALKTAGDATALASYQDGLLQTREAWQFTRPLEARIRGYERKAHLVDIEMQAEGRLQGTRWLLDADAIAW